MARSAVITAGWELQTRGIAGTLGADNPTDGSWTSGATAISTSVVRPGGSKASLKVGPTNGSGFVVVQQNVNLRTCIRVYTYWTAFPDAGQLPYLITTNVSATNTISAGMIVLRVDSTGLLGVYNGTNTTALSTPTQLVLNTWHCVELITKYSNTGAFSEGACRVDKGAPFWTATGQTWSQTLNSYIFMGLMFGTVTTPIVYLDDLAVAYVDTNSDWLGDGTCVILRPKRDISIASWTKDTSASPTVNLWDAGDNIPPVGIADNTTSATPHQIRNGSGTMPQYYDVVCETYAAAGVPGPVMQTDITGTDAALGDATARTSIAQAFLMNGTFATVDLNIASVGTPTDDLIVELQSDNAGVPSGTVLSTANFPTGAVTGTSAYLNIRLPDYPLTTGVTYWIVIRRAGSIDAANYYKFKRRATGAVNYEDGAFATYNGTTWTADSTVDLAFKAFPTQGYVPINVLQPQVCHGEAVATGTKTGSIQLLSNPVTSAATFNYGDDLGAAGAFPGNNWKWKIGTNANQPGGLTNAGLAPTIRLAKTDTTTRVALACFLGVWVEFGTPQSTGPYPVSSWLQYNKTADGTKWWAKQHTDRTDYVYDIGAGEVTITVDPGDWAVRADPIDPDGAVVDMDDATLRAGYTLVVPQP